MDWERRRRGMQQPWQADLPWRHAGSRFPAGACEARRRDNVISRYQRSATVEPQKEVRMVPLLLWILGVPGLIIILLLVLGIVHL